MVDLTEDLMIRDQLGAQRVQAVIGQRLADTLGQRAEDGPVFLGLALREDRAESQLYAAFGIGEQAVLLVDEVRRCIISSLPFILTMLIHSFIHSFIHSSTHPFIPTWKLEMHLCFVLLNI